MKEPKAVFARPSTNFKAPTISAMSSQDFRLPLQGKTAIVTGASRGIGSGIASELGRRGANVCLCYPLSKYLHQC